MCPRGRSGSVSPGLDLPLDELERYLASVPYQSRTENYAAPTLPVPAHLSVGRKTARSSTQEVFGRLMSELARSDLPLAERMVTTSPDVTVSTSLGGWVSRRGVFHRELHDDVFKAQAVTSPTTWHVDRHGQHLELGIAENNLFLNLAALGLAHELFGERLIPIGTLYDPFIARGLDALTYACYVGARFILVATPSGISLAPEGGAHQSIGTPLIGMGHPGLTYFEPAYGDELAAVFRWGLEHIQAADGGGAV